MHWHTLRAKPPRAPRNLSRLDQHVELSYAGDVDSARAAPRKRCGAGDFGCVSHDDESVSAESGYLRETGNLVFHTGLCVVIIGVAVGHLFGWRGDVILTEGDTFSSTLSSYDSFLPGAMDRPGEAAAVHHRAEIDERHLRGPGGRCPVRRAPELHGGRHDDRAAGWPVDAVRDQPEPPGHPRRCRRLPARQRVRAGGDGPRRVRGGALPARPRRSWPQDNVYTSVGAIKVRGRAADGAGVQRLLPPDRRADVMRTAPRRSSRTTATRSWPCRSGRATCSPPTGRSRSTPSTRPTSPS